ncbi:hypothetical protein T02_8021 [Trichinella nativa]|uniref:Uncharacterized protein n=1 Tax=Trichinella nativa TaxID=6335 RepID=A0A0V1LLM6_9BILA|nr:hypothetical protein T02_8021 [Trichinella nativa]
MNYFCLLTECVINLILARNCISQYREQFLRRRSLFVFNFQSTLLLRVKINIYLWNGLTDRTSCFDRKLCTDWSWLCETSRFCSTETGVCGLMIHSLLGKLLNLSSLLTTPTVVQNCRCCVLSALSSSSSSSSSCDFSAANITD